MIDRNRSFYHSHKDILEPWLIESSSVRLDGAVRKMGANREDNLNMKQVLGSRGSGVRIKNIDYSPTLANGKHDSYLWSTNETTYSTRVCSSQSFSEDYIIHNNDKIAYKQFGNAVNVKMIKDVQDFSLIMNLL